MKLASNRLQYQGSISPLLFSEAGGDRGSLGIAVGRALADANRKGREGEQRGSGGRERRWAGSEFEAGGRCPTLA